VTADDVSEATLGALLARTPAMAEPFPSDARLAVAAQLNPFIAHGPGAAAKSAMRALASRRPLPPRMALLLEIVPGDPPLGPRATDELVFAAPSVELRHALGSGPYSGGAGGGGGGDEVSSSGGVDLAASVLQALRVLSAMATRKPTAAASSQEGEAGAHEGEREADSNSIDSSDGSSSIGRCSDSGSSSIGSGSDSGSSISCSSISSSDSSSHLSSHGSSSSISRSTSSTSTSGSKSSIKSIDDSTSSTSSSGSKSRIKSSHGSSHTASHMCVLWLHADLDPSVAAEAAAIAVRLFSDGNEALATGACGQAIAATTTDHSTGSVGSLGPAWHPLQLGQLLVRAHLCPIFSSRYTAAQVAYAGSSDFLCFDFLLKVTSLS
jgi:hypothetical protein